MNPRHAPAEVLDRPERLARWLIQQAARTSPPSLSERLQEEWLADLAAQRRGLSRLRFAIGCCWATQVIAHDQVALSGAATSARGRGPIVTLAQHDPSLFSRRTIIFFLIVSVHALMIYGLANGLVQTVAEAIQPPTVTRIVNEPSPQETASPAPEPNLWHPLVSLPVPDPLDFPPDTATAGDTVISPPQNASSAPLPANVVHRLLGGPGPGFPDTNAYYPYASRRLGETGVATVRVCVDGNGRLASDAAIAQSSGSARLDEGALKLAKAGSGHYRSTTEDGRPVSYCYPFRIRFELKK